MTPPIRPGLTAACMTDNKTIKKNVKLSRRYQHVEWGVLNKPPCALVGGGPSTKTSLEILRKWDGDVIAVNDTAGYLSDNGIPCYVYSADSTEVLFKIGPLVKGALFASRCDREQFKQFKRADVRIFHMYEDGSPGDVEGGGTGVARTPHLLLRMGYRGVYYFGCDGSFYDRSHVSGKSEAALWNMMVVRAGGVDYLTNAAFVIQSEYLGKVMRKNPEFLFNASDGLLKAMLANWDTWEVVAIRDDLRKQYEAQGVTAWSVEYDMREHEIWRPEYASAS